MSGYRKVPIYRESKGKEPKATSPPLLRELHPSIGRTDVETETPILWPPDVKS